MRNKIYIDSDMSTNLVRDNRLYKYLWETLTKELTELKVDYDRMRKMYFGSLDELVEE